jgi:predicted TIM-barrel fold metal-dependent hydrolase
MTLSVLLLAFDWFSSQSRTLEIEDCSAVCDNEKPRGYCVLLGQFRKGDEIMAEKAKGVSRREFIVGGPKSMSTLVALGSVSGAAGAGYQGPVLDAHMHLEAYGNYWEGLVEEIIEHYDHARVDKGVIFTAWTPSRESNDRTLDAYRKYPNRFIPFGHVRTEDADWERELERIGDLGWKGIKLHQSEISRGPDLMQRTLEVVERAASCGIRIMLIHLADIEIIGELSKEIPEVTWILPHMGSYRNKEEMRRYCELARERTNIYLDTSGADYYRFGQQFEWAGPDKIVYASDGFWFSPFVERAKIEVLQLPTPFRTPRLTDAELGMILGGNLERILQNY